MGIPLDRGKPIQVRIKQKNITAMHEAEDGLETVEYVIGGRRSMGAFGSGGYPYSARAQPDNRSVAVDARPDDQQRLLFQFWRYIFRPEEGEQSRSSQLRRWQVAMRSNSEDLSQSPRIARSRSSSYQWTIQPLIPSEESNFISQSIQLERTPMSMSTNPECPNITQSTIGMESPWISMALPRNDPQPLLPATGRMDPLNPHYFSFVDR
jgi:hypothetical protein